MRKNPDQRTVDLRAKYRKRHGNDWWRDDDVKAEYSKEKRNIYRNDSKSTKSTKKTSEKRKSTKVTDMLDPKLRTAINVAQTALKTLFPNRIFEVDENYGGGGTAVVFSEDETHTVSVELIPKRKYVHYQATIEEHMDGVQGGIFRTANGVVEKDNLPGDLDLLADSMGLFESMNNDFEEGFKVTVMYDGKLRELMPGSDLYNEYADWFLIVDV